MARAMRVGPDAVAQLLKKLGHGAPGEMREARAKLDAHTAEMRKRDELEQLRRGVEAFPGDPRIHGPVDMWIKQLDDLNREDAAARAAQIAREAKKAPKKGGKKAPKKK
jgi:hypothetical protein|tara:strand:- start:603 stop:929 length:327 start_codon:yes stop_codon:yes gene_type:complete